MSSCSPLNVQPHCTHEEGGKEEKGKYCIACWGRGDSFIDEKIGSPMVGTPINLV